MLTWLCCFCLCEIFTYLFSIESEAVMEIFVVAFGVMLLLVTAMSIGVLMGKKPISGSCGGMSALGMEVACDVCGGDKTKCDKEDTGATSSVGNLTYNAADK
jgi:hypothetical protein